MKLAPALSPTPIVEHTASGAVHVTHVTHVAAADELRAVAALAREWGLEPGALLRAATRAGIVAKVGRQVVARRSDILRLVELLPKPKAAPVSPDANVAYADFVGKAGAR